MGVTKISEFLGDSSRTGKKVRAGQVQPRLNCCKQMGQNTLGGGRGVPFPFPVLLLVPQTDVSVPAKGEESKALRMGHEVSYSSESADPKPNLQRLRMSCCLSVDIVNLK